MGRDPLEVGVRGQQRQLEADAEPGHHGVDRAHLDAAAPAIVAQVGAVNVIAPRRARRRSATSGVLSGASRRSASDQTSHISHYPIPSRFIFL